MDPAITVAAPLLVTLRSATGVTAVTTFAPESEPLLFEASGSVVVAVLEATLVSEPLVGAVTVTVKLVIAPAARFVTAPHQTVPFPLVPSPDALTKTVFVGNKSLTTTLDAVFGPRFVTVMV